MVARNSKKGEDSRTRILDTAESLFAKSGLNVSVREIAAEADANLAGINYYFGSKAGLTQAVLERLSQRINSERIVALDTILERAKSSRARPKMREIISAFLVPYFQDRTDSKLLAKIILQHRLEPTEMTKLVLDRHFAPMAARFIESFAQACPDVSRPKFYWRYAFMINAIVLTLANLDDDTFMEEISNGRASFRNFSKLAEELTDFIVGGLSERSSS